MTIRRHFPIIFRLIGAARIEASGNCQKSPAAMSLKRPTWYRKYLIEKIISATNRAPMRFFPVNSLFGRENTGIFGPVAMEAIQHVRTARRHPRGRFDLGGIGAGGD